MCREPVKIIVDGESVETELSCGGKDFAIKTADGNTTVLQVAALYKNMALELVERAIEFCHCRELSGNGRHIQ